MNEQNMLLSRAFDWIVRIPLCGEAEVARLLGVGEHVARRALFALVQLGWIESLEPASGELEARRRYVIRADAVSAFAIAIGAGAIEHDLPVRLRDILYRVTQFEITVGVGRLLADLAEHVRRTGVVELDDARSLPLSVAAGERWWLPGANAYGCLRMGEQCAPFLVAWDRAAAPDEHRRRRVRAWINARATAARPWGTDGLPTMLLICPGERERAVWERALLKACDDDPLSVPSVLSTTRQALRVDGVGGAIWRRPGGAEPMFLVNAIGWGTRPPVGASWLSDCPGPLPDLPPRRGDSLRAWALKEVLRPNGPVWRRLGAIVVLLGPAERAIVEWIARYPLLSAADIAPVLNESVALVERRLEWVVRCDLIRPYAYRGAVGSAEGTDEARYVLAPSGDHFLADRAAVPVALFREHAGIKPRKRRPGGQPLFVRHVEHTLGTNRVIAQLARSARVRGGRLAEMCNDAESAWSFIDNGKRCSIRPDASGMVDLAGLRTPFVLEYDRGTLDGGDLATKFDGYLRFYAYRAWRERYEREPLLLFVCSDTRAARRVIRAANAASLVLPMLVTTEVRLASARGSGAFGMLALIGPRPGGQRA